MWVFYCETAIFQLSNHESQLRHSRRFQPNPHSFGEDDAAASNEKTFKIFLHFQSLENGTNLAIVAHLEVNVLQ